MYCFAEIQNLKKDFKYAVITQTPDDMAEYLSENYRSYIVLDDIENSSDKYLEIDCEVLWK